MKKIAILLENLFDEHEVIYPYHRFKEDFEVLLVGTEAGKVYKSKEGFSLKSDAASRDVSADSFDALFIPGGFSPDYMRRSEATIKLVKAMHDQGKPIAAICHAGWVLASAIDLGGKKVTSYPTLKDDLVHAGAEWVNEIVVDDNLVTGRNPQDLPGVVKAFIKKLT